MKKLILISGILTGAILIAATMLNANDANHALNIQKWQNNTIQKNNSSQVIYECGRLFDVCMKTLHERNACLHFCHKHS